jgi:ABC-type transporter Mla MlaB component
MNPIPAVANIRFADLVKRADGSPITSGTVNFYVYCTTGSNAGKWFRGSDSSWQAAESVAGVMTHLSDGHWYVSLASGAWTAGDIVLEYAEESTNLHTPISRQVHVEYMPGWTSAGKAPATVASGDDADAASIKTAVGAAGAGLTALPAVTLATSQPNYAPAKVSDLGTVQTGDSFAVVKSGAPGDAAAIKAKTDTLPASPAAVGSAMTLTSAYDAAKSAAAPGAKMDLVDAPNATAIAAIVAAVWAATTRTLSSFGTLVSDTASAVWGAATRSLTDKAGFTISGTKTTLDALNDITAASVWSSATRTLTSFGTLTADAATAVWGAGTRALTDKAGFFISGTKTTLDALNDITASAVWANATRTLTSFGTLASDTATAVWGAGTRTLSSFGTLASDIWSYATRLLSTPPGDATAASQTTICNAIGSLASQVAAIPTNPYTGTPPTVTAIRAEMDANSTQLARLDAPVSTRLAASAYAAPDIPSPEENAAAVLAATGVTAGGTTTVAEVLAALFSFTRGKIVQSGNSYTYYDDDGATPLFTLTIAAGERTPG